MNLSKLVVLFFVCITSVANAQYKFSDDSPTFVQELETVLKNTKNEKSIQAADKFSASFASLSKEGKKSVIDIAKTMAKKRLRASPHFTDLALSINGAVAGNMASADLDTFLIVTQSVLATFDNKQINEYFTTVRLLLDESKLYHSAYNSLIVSGGSFRFRLIEAAPEYNPYDREPEVEEQQDDWNWEKQDNKSMVERQTDFFSDWDSNTAFEDEWGSIGDDWGEETEVKDVNKYDVGYVAAAQPTIAGAVIEFTDVDLGIIANSDSAQIRGTSGTILLKDGTFVGNGGKFDWSSVGYAPDELYVELKEYNFLVKSTKVTAEGVSLHFPAKTDQVVEGVFEYISSKNKKDKQYPRFKSFNANINVKGLGEDITYYGGLSLAGRHIYSSSLDEDFSTIEVKKGGEVKFKAKSNRFELGDSLVLADYATVTVFAATDSITHPGTSIKYNREQSILRVTKTAGYRNAPFIDTYHQMAITADALIWDLNTNNIDFTILNAKSHIPAIFESEHFYEYNKYSHIQGIYRFHPLQLIVGYADRNKTNVMYANELARVFQLEENTIRGAMTALMKSGFVEYNVKTGQVKLRPKARHFVQARRDLTDYDNITFVSLYSIGSNATLDLTTNELKVRGVDKISVSDSLNVFFVPNDHEITILKNRDFIFDGKINTANFQFVGVGFAFNYDSFLVHMPQIDQIKLAVDTKKGTKNEKGARVLGNELKYSAGTLYINKPDNKSSRKHLPQYPIFDANAGATVFFDKKEIAGGAYDTTIQFKIPPFMVDSLSSDDPQAIGFDGTFTSGGIFPDFEEKLIVMPDFSLGFNHKAPAEGYQLYKGKGKYYNNISLDNNGLTGDGEIHFLNTTCWSKDFHFYPDSVLTVGTNTITKEGPNPDISPDILFPEFSVRSYEMRWLVAKDSMYLTNTPTEPFRFYNKTAILNGTANITENGTYGSGVLEMKNSETASAKFHFERDEYDARNANFIIKSDNPRKPAVKCVDVKLNFDLLKKKAIFSPEIKGYASIEFPYSQYKTSIDNGEWDMEKKAISMVTPDEGDISKSYFYSTRPDQDSLVFNATKAVYDIDQLKLNITGVPYIVVADTRVYPDENKVVIQENAVMETLLNSKIVMDTINEYHKLERGEIDILSRFKFEGTAIYDYKNVSDKRFLLTFSNFKFLEPGKKKEKHSVATSTIMPEDSMEISDKILYKGMAKFNSHEKPFYFDGFVKLDLKGALSYSNWLAYKNDGDTTDVKISLVGATADNGKPLATGLFLDAGRQIYPAFISQKRKDTDFEILSVLGDLQVKPDSNEFKIAPSADLKKSDIKYNTFSYYDYSSTVRFKGRFKYLEPHNSISIGAAGTGVGDLNTEEFTFNNFMLCRFTMHKKVASALGKALKGAAVEEADSLPEYSAFDFGTVQLKQQQLYSNLEILAGQKAVENYKSKSSLEYVPFIKLSGDFGKSIVLSDVKLKWSQEYMAWYSVGTIKVANFMKEDINKEMNGHLEIKKTLNGDIVNLYLEPSVYNWYFFTYDDNRLGILTHDSDVNEQVAARSKGELPDRTKYYFTEAAAMEKVRFLTDFNEKYLGKVYEPPVMPVFRTQPEEDYEEVEEDIEEEVPSPNEIEEEVEEESEGSYEFEEMDLPDAPAKKKQSNMPKEEEWRRNPKPEQSVEDRKQLQREQQRMKDLLK